MNLYRIRKIIAAVVLCCISIMGFFHLKNGLPDQRLMSLNIRDITYPESRHFFPEPPSHFTCLNGVLINWSYGNELTGYEDIVAMHLVHTPDKVPAAKNHKTLFLTYNLESEYHTDQSRYMHDVHFMVNYNLAHSVPAPFTYYNRIEPFVLALLRPPLVSFESKKGIVWFCDNCGAKNYRTEIVANMMRYLPIDSYGECLGNKIDVRYDKINGNLTTVDMYRQYKFVLAIENSNCEDYVTEKFKNVIFAGAVPIVLTDGRYPDYEKFAPPGSYINIASFTSMKHLADRLKEIMNDKTLYESHFYYKEPTELMEKYESMTSSELLDWARNVKFKEYIFSRELLLKEDGQSIYCKIADYLLRNGRIHPLRRRYQPLLSPRQNLSYMCLAGSAFYKFTS